MEKDKEKCPHDVICIVTEVSQSEYSKLHRNYVQCHLCDEVLPIKSVLTKTIKVP